MIGKNVFQEQKSSLLLQMEPPQEDEVTILLGLGGP